MGSVLLIGTDAGLATDVRRELQRQGHRLVWVRGTLSDTVGEKPDAVLIAIPASAQAAVAKWLDTQAAMLSSVPTARLAAASAADVVARARELLVKSAPPSAPRLRPPPPPARASGKLDDRVFADASGNIRPVGPVATRRLSRRRGELSVLPSPDDVVLMRPTGERRRLRLAGEIAAPGSMCDVVMMIAHSHLGGELVVVDDTATRSIFFEPDHLVSAASSAHAERLGEVLYRHGALSREQVHAATALASERNIRFGEAVVQLRHLTVEQVFSLTSRQIDEVFQAIVTADTGLFYFFDEFAETRLSYRHREPIPALVLHAVQRMDEMRFFRDKIPTDGHVPDRATEAAPSVRGDHAARVLASIDGVRSVRDLCRDLGEPELAVTRALFELVQLGAIVVQPPRESSTHAIVGVFNSAMRMLMRELDAIDDTDAVRLELGRFARNHGLYAALFRNALPADDGTLDPGRISSNISRMSAPDHADRMLADSLYEYASYALFLARPHLARAEGSAPKEAAPKKTRLSGTFRDLLAPLTAEERGESVPQSTRKPD